MKRLLEDLFMFIVFVAVLLLTLAAVNFTVSVVFGAPAPLTRNKSPSPFIGQWNLTFYSTEYSIHLYSNGSYTAVDKENNRWIGKWHHKDGWIFVTEYRIHQHGIYVEKGNRYTWSVMIEGNSNRSIRIWRKVL